ncbi:DUF2442 domain-containing protein [Synechococcus sp. PCC 7336]|uniref:DUF2442 domain-containing protein n=1 Tax=Synechococcus sp. PCC 7336 TaxID=195250 RepID=UPI000345458D|nr:DUF2442 domain-containing protein [Synechococcus sp. PCC 7336]
MTEIEIADTLVAEIERARQRGKQLNATEPRARVARYSSESDRVTIELTNGIVVGFPRHLLQGLGDATAAQLAEVEISPSGYGLHWDALDVDLGVPELMAGIFGTKRWMSELGRKGGQVISEAKATAARENGKNQKNLHT